VLQLLHDVIHHFSSVSDTAKGWGSPTTVYSTLDNPYEWQLRIKIMSTQIDIKRTLAAKYGEEADFPSWTTPFIHAVGLLEKVEDQDIPPDLPAEMIRRENGERFSAEIPAEEKELQRLEKEAVANLESVSINRMSPCIII
jgi:hypothetical protein